MKEIRTRWTALILWLAVIGTVWLIGEAVGWKRVRAKTNPVQSRTVLAIVGLVGVTFILLNGRKES